MIFGGVRAASILASPERPVELVDAVLKRLCCNTLGGLDPQAVLVHQLSKKATQNPFRKSRGRVVRVAFHPAKPFFFVATLNHVYVYNLAKQELAKKLKAGSSNITSLAIHSSGDHVLVGKQVSC